LQTALRLTPQPFARHAEPTGLNVSGAQPRRGRRCLPGGPASTSP